MKLFGANRGGAQTATSDIFLQSKTCYLPVRLSPCAASIDVVPSLGQMAGSTTVLGYISERPMDTTHERLKGSAKGYQGAHRLWRIDRRCFDTEIRQPLRAVSLFDSRQARTRSRRGSNLSSPHHRPWLSQVRENLVPGPERHTNHSAECVRFPEKINRGGGIRTHDLYHPKVAR